MAHSPINTRLPRTLPVVLLILAVSPATAPAQWPEFRGPGAQGIVGDTDAPNRWSESDNVQWKTPLPGEGWSSPVVMGDQVWMTTAIESGQAKPEEDGADSVERVNLYAICVSRSTGKVVHNLLLFDVTNPEKKHAQNSYASPTPVVRGGKVWCHFGRNGTVCLDAVSGKVLWEKKFVIDHYVGAGSSPVLVDDLLVLTCDGADKQFILGVDASSGNIAWKTNRPPIRGPGPDQRKSFCTPLVINHDGVRQIVIPGAQWIAAYAPENGKELWRLDHGRGFSLVARPVYDGQKVYFCTAFAGNDMQAVRLGGMGELPPDAVAWRCRRAAPKQPSPVVRSGQIVMVSDNGIAQCLDTASGDSVWKLRLGGNYSASVMHANGLYWFFSKEGVATAVSDDGKKVHHNQLDGSYMATPAIVDGQWLIRTDKGLYCIGKVGEA